MEKKELAIFKLQMKAEFAAEQIEKPSATKYI